eukprot:1161263-Pelagomonas_calceolata.AAC.36
MQCSAVHPGMVWDGMPVIKLKGRNSTLQGSAVQYNAVQPWGGSGEHACSSRKVALREREGYQLNQTSLNGRQKACSARYRLLTSVPVGPKYIKTDLGLHPHAPGGAYKPSCRALEAEWVEHIRPATWGCGRTWGGIANKLLGA